MLFLFSPRGMGIAPIIELPVVSGRDLPLLPLPRFDGFGANESQPSRLFVVDGAVIVLKAGIALRALLLVLAIVIEPLDSRPCAIRTGLTGLGIEVVGKGILVGKLSTIALQVVLPDAAFVHPQAQAFVADELDEANGFINGGILLF